jgi:hypothetical protein
LFTEWDLEEGRGRKSAARGEGVFKKSKSEEDIVTGRR